MSKSKTTKNPVRLGLYVTEKRDGDYYHVRATVVTIGLNRWEMRSIDEGRSDYARTVSPSKIRNAGDELYDGLWLDGLQVNSQGNNRDEPRNLYGFDVTYRDVFSIDRRRAEHMAKTLATVEKRMDRVYAQFGSAATIGAYVARVAHAIGADAIVVLRGKSLGWSYDESDNRIMTIADGIYHVDGLARAWVQERELAAAEREQQRAREQAAREQATSAQDASAQVDVDAEAS